MLPPQVRMFNVFLKVSSFKGPNYMLLILTIPKKKNNYLPVTKNTANNCQKDLFKRGVLIHGKTCFQDLLILNPW